jgi:hypothetical protein
VSFLVVANVLSVLLLPDGCRGPVRVVVALLNEVFLSIRILIEAGTLNKHLKVGLISKYIYFYYVLSIEPNR